MAKLQREAIRIVDLWRRCGPATPKIDLIIAFKEIVLPSSGGDQCLIIFEDFKSFEGMMARENSHSDWCIGISTSISYLPRRNFTLAHEIGHFIGHRYEKDRFECTFEDLNDFTISRFENEANEFAAQLLMPADYIRKFDREEKFSHETVTELSASLGVSRAAAAFRWIKLSTKKLGFIVSRDGMICSGRASDRLFTEGVFFKSGAELPARCASQKLTGPGQAIQVKVPERIWHEWLDCWESCFATEIGGYVYTYLDFGS